MNNRHIIMFFSALLGISIALAPTCHAFDIDDLDDLLYPKTEKTISMDFSDAELSNVLKIFSQQSGLNFIAAANIGTKKVNLYLDEVPVEEALERILSANNLTYEIKPGSNIFVVNEVQTAAIKIMTRVYNLKFATVPSSKLHNTLSEDEEGEEGSSSQSSGETTSGIIAAVEAVLSDDGTVVEDIRTNSLIVSDIPSQFPLIESTITRLDVRIPQILIEAELLDISQTTADLLGAKFGDTPLNFTGASRQTLVPFDRNKAFRNSNKTAGQGFEFSGNEITTGTLAFEGLSIALQSLRTQTDTKNLARPRILTLNNDTAEIAIRTDEAIGLSSSTTAAEGTSTAVAEAERVETGVFLKVTPQANTRTMEITMAIEPKVIQARTGGTFGGQTFKDPEERGSKSILRVKDGETIVLGGLLRTDMDNIRTSVPVLGKIPVLGAPFRHKDKSETRRELIIFITPSIVKEDQKIRLSKPLLNQKNQIREQSIPSSRSKVIENELANFE